MDPDPLLLSISHLETVEIAEIILLLSLIICSALISGTEVAFFSLSQKDKNALKEESKGESLVVKLLEKPKKLLATILITNNFINILIVLLFADLDFFAKIKEPFELSLVNIEIPAKYVRFSLEIGLVTTLILLFGEVLPKVYASRRALQFSNFMSKPMNILSFGLSIPSRILTSLTGAIERQLGNKNSNFSVETLSQALELTSDDATTKDEQKILEGIVTFGSTETIQIMKPRIDIFALSDEAPHQEVISKILENGYSRNPVYQESIDNIIGILYAKDLLAHLNKKNFKWTSILREPFFVPENKKLDDLLSDFRERKNHMAIVVDEYGGTSGIVTLEDVIEEIVGDINDEFDEDDLAYSKIDTNTYIFDGKITIKDFCKVLEDDDEEKFEEKKGESETIAGFILEISGRFPKVGEKILFEHYVFTIEALDQKRIKQLKVVRKPINA